MTRDEKLFFEAVTLMLKITDMMKKEYNELKEMRLRRIDKLLTRRAERRMKVLEVYK
jgi:hypothetical protein